MCFQKSVYFFYFQRETWHRETARETVFSIVTEQMPVRNLTRWEICQTHKMVLVLFRIAKVSLVEKHVKM